MTISSISGSRFAENAIIVTVATDSNDVPENSSLGLVRLFVGSFELTAEVKIHQADTVKFDISSVARAVLAGSEPSATSFDTNPSASLTVSGRVEYLKDGEYITGSTQSAGSVSVILGGYRHSELYGATEASASSAVGSCTFTKKPSRGVGSPELIKSGDSMLISTTGTPPVTTAYQVTTIGQVGTTGVYAYPSSDKNLVGFRFLNRFGVIENCTAKTRESMSITMDSEERSLAHEPSYAAYQDKVIVKTNIRKQWAMSSGPVSRAWAEWWADEFVAAKKHWMRMSDGSYVPVTVSGDDGVKVYDKVGGELPEVEFTVAMGV